MLDETIERMKLLKLHSNVIREFKEEHKLNRSESKLGILYWLTDEEQELVTDFEKTHKGLMVYHVIKTLSQDFGVVYDLLYLTEDTDDWKIDREYLKDNLVLSYTVTQFAECGYIQVKCINGGLARLY